MLEAVELWDEILTRDSRALRKKITWGEAGVCYAAHGRISVIARVGTREYGLFRTGEVIAPARIFLQERINSKLAALGVDVRLIRSHPSPESPFALYQVPRSLLGAIWLQFAGGVCGGRKYRRCDAEDCGNWFEVAGGRDRSARSDKRFCSPACKVRIHYRKRHPTKPR
ncbi:MAG: hypothetical protein JNN08_24120 [Bryobacterales bacterium]|nr:hypothetical protein [Bryobacterales bacterium]